jgi:hypothetical protein
MAKDILDKFGILLMEWVRDWSIEELDSILNGNGKGPEQKQLSSFYKALPPNSRDALEKLIPVAVDTALHYFLWLVEENQDLDLVMKTPDGLQSVKKESDGLSGELYSTKGWIARFSKQRCNWNKIES